jgi:molybdenum cofactor cytidylyltransferase
MGQPKQLLPWGNSTVLAAVVAAHFQAGADPVVCVVGHRAGEMADAVAHTAARVVVNPDYVDGEMVSSFRAGLSALSSDGTLPIPRLGALLALGDQPHVPAAVISAIIAQARRTPECLVMPSYRMRRGHPIFLPVHLWTELIELPHPATLRTLRDLLAPRQDDVVYVTVGTDAILRDIDTPADYAALTGALPS